MKKMGVLGLLDFCVSLDFGNLGCYGFGQSSYSRIERVKTSCEELKE